MSLSAIRAIGPDVIVSCRVSWCIMFKKNNEVHGVIPLLQSVQENLIVLTIAAKNCHLIIMSQVP